MEKQITPIYQKVRKYVATISQNGTAAPVVNVLLNTLGADITWTRASAGRYVATADKAIFETTNTTAQIVHGNTTTGDSGVYIGANSISKFTTTSQIIFQQNNVVDPYSAVDGIKTPSYVEITYFE